MFLKIEIKPSKISSKGNKLGDKEIKNLIELFNSNNAGDIILAKGIVENTEYNSEGLHKVINLLLMNNFSLDFNDDIFPIKKGIRGTSVLCLTRYYELNEKWK